MVEVWSLNLPKATEVLETKTMTRQHKKNLLRSLLRLAIQ